MLKSTGGFLSFIFPMESFHFLQFFEGSYTLTVKDIRRGSLHDAFLLTK